MIAVSSLSSDPAITASAMSRIFGWAHILSEHADCDCYNQGKKCYFKHLAVARCLGMITSFAAPMQIQSSSIQVDSG